MMPTLSSSTNYDAILDSHNQICIKLYITKSVGAVSKIIFQSLIFIFSLIYGELMVFMVNLWLFEIEW